ncbi:MAG: hypothetical protein CMK09_19080 [Ponticaulis sp.]|nr:hypothetical protein [Ponticaulis sp.]
MTAASFAESDFEGSWRSANGWGELRLQQNGDTVQGDYGDRGIIWGKVKNDVLRAVFTYTDASGTVPVTTPQPQYGFVEFYRKGGLMKGRWKWRETLAGSTVSDPAEWVADRVSAVRPTLTHTGNSAFGRPGSINWFPLASQAQMDWVSFQTDTYTPWPDLKVPDRGQMPVDKDFPDMVTGPSGDWTGTYEIDGSNVYLRQSGDWVWGRKGDAVTLLGYVKDDDLRGVFTHVDSRTGLTHSFTRWGMFELRKVNDRVLGNWKWRETVTNSSRDGLWAGQRKMSSQPQMPDPASLGADAVFPSRMTEEDYYWMTFSGSDRAPSGPTLPNDDTEYGPKPTNVSAPDKIELIVSKARMNQTGGLERFDEFFGSIYVRVKAGNQLIPEESDTSSTVFRRTSRELNKERSIAVKPPTGSPLTIRIYDLPPAVENGSQALKIVFDIMVIEGDRLRINQDKCEGEVEIFPSGAPWWKDTTLTYRDEANLKCDNGISVTIPFRISHAN